MVEQLISDNKKRDAVIKRSTGYIQTILTEVIPQKPKNTRTNDSNQ